MHRLFSTFPNSLPGAGLLLLRLALACPVLAVSLSHGSADKIPVGYAQIFFSVAIAICLILGIATPFVGAALTLVLLWNGYADQSALILLWSLAGASASLMLIGPGAWSIDAVVFGRRRIDVQRR